ncbi:MAG: ABC transporter permease [Proteobacteria bacterium]|nr:ABC transporter permease [Pseudomonadota bacterium]
MFFRLVILSLWNRRSSILLTILSIAISVSLLLGVDHLRRQAKDSFSKTVSGVDLIVGARSGQVNLLLYSVFRVGNATNNISWESYREIAENKNIAWTIPISLGDSHKGFRVMGTTQSYFDHYRFGDKQPLTFSKGESFKGVYDAVLGYSVAKELGYQVEQKIIISHGLGKVSFSNHDDKPFTVVGILQATGTPVDRTVHVSLAGIEAIHLDWQQGVKIPGLVISAEDALKHDLTPASITAMMVGLKSKIATFKLQRYINEYRKEPLMAVLPGVALVELWQIVSVIENLLLIISAMVVVAGLTGMLTTLIAGLNERRREIAILRSLGAQPLYVFLLLMIEAVVLALIGCLLGVALIFVLLAIIKPILVTEYGLFISAMPISLEMVYVLTIIISLATLLGLIPSLIAYKRSLKDGLTVKV